jgi:hypothetical protein
VLWNGLDLDLDCHLQIGCVKLNSGIVRGHMFRLVLSFGNWLYEVEIWFCGMAWI